MHVSEQSIVPLELHRFVADSMLAVGRTATWVFTTATREQLAGVVFELDIHGDEADPAAVTTTQRVAVTLRGDRTCITDIEELPSDGDATRISAALFAGPCLHHDVQAR